MVAYAIPAAQLSRFAGGSQTFILQPPRSRLARHAQVGETMHLRFGRAKANQLLAARCVVRAELHIAADGLRRVLDEQRLAASSDADKILSRCLQAEDGMANAAAAREDLARALGFDDWAGLWRHVVAGGKGEFKRGVYRRELIGWVLT